MSDRKTRREKRRIARQLFAQAAEDMGLSRLAFARLVKDRDADAVVALAAAREEVVTGPLDDVDWDKVMEIIMQIAEILLTLLPLFI